MKMFNSLFWGGALIILGTGLIVNLVFNLHIPVFKILLGLFVIFLGIRILTGKTMMSCHAGSESDDVVFGETHFSATGNWKNQEKNIVFGQCKIDLTQVKPEDSLTGHLKVNTVFGKTIILLDRNIPVRLKVNSAFANVVLPDKNEMAFGNTVFTHGDISGSSGFLDLETSVAFGRLIISFVN